jgi:hypothetical protein
VNKGLVFLRSSAINHKEDTVLVLGKPAFDLKGGSINLKPEDDYLYQFSLFYFDFIHYLSGEDVTVVFNRYLKDLQKEKHFYHPYVASKRLINLFLLLGSTQELQEKVKSVITQQIKKDASFIYANIEYHVDGNHLLSNYAALAIYERHFEAALESLHFGRYLVEFKEQFKGGLHFERSLAYTSQLLHEALLVFQYFRPEVDDEIFSVIEKSLKLQGLFRQSGNQLDFVDNIYEQSFEVNELIEVYRKAFNRCLKKETAISPVVACDYVLLFNKSFSLCIDCGHPSPPFQPGHARDSCGAIELSHNSRPIFISGNTSTYSSSARRSKERSRFNFSKVVSEGVFQEVWASFRVGKRVRPTYSASSQSVDMVASRGSRSFTRRVQLFDNTVVIADSGKEGEMLVSQFILPPACTASVLDESCVIIDSGFARFEFRAGDSVELNYEFIGVRYGVLEVAPVIVCISKNSKSTVSIREISK